MIVDITFPKIVAPSNSSFVFVGNKVKFFVSYYYVLIVYSI